MSLPRNHRCVAGRRTSTYCRTTFHRLRHCCQLIHHGCTSIYATFCIDFRKFSLFLPSLYIIINFSTQTLCRLLRHNNITSHRNVFMSIPVVVLLFHGMLTSARAFFFISTYYSLLYLHKVYFLYTKPL